MAMDEVAVNRGKRTKRASSDEEEDDSVVTEEEKDMAECLILLASGVGGENKKLGSGCYECEKTFHSFHRKSNQQSTTETKTFPSCNDDDDDVLGSYSISLQKQLFTPSIPTTKNKNDDVCSAKSSIKVHQCSICGSEFSSGQALGGHMRRHRTVRIIPYAPMSSTDHQSSSVVKTQSMLSLDLNFPAPEEEDQQNAAFREGVFSTHSMAGCHCYK